LETEEDYPVVENLTREAFWNVYRPGCTEHYVLHQFRGREEFVPELDLVLEKEREIIGHVMYARVAIRTGDSGRVPVMTFGPISIAPEYKGQGYGSFLLNASMERARELAAGALAITGDIDFYGKSGFVIARTRGIRYEDDPEVDYFRIKELKPGFLDGVSGTYKDPEGYFVSDEDVERFDRSFPPKERLKLPGQLF